MWSEPSGQTCAPKGEGSCIQQTAPEGLFWAGCAKIYKTSVYNLSLCQIHVTSENDRFVHDMIWYTFLTV